MNHEQIFTPGIRKAAVQRVLQAALENGVSLNQGDRFILVWDKSFNCRAYSTTVDNFHFGVSSLDGVFCNFSAHVTVS